MKLEGGCACGQVRFVTNNKPLTSFFCQCRSCQHMTGSGHAAQFVQSSANFSTAGELSRWVRPADEGHELTKYFCANCGSPIYGTTTRNDGIVVVLIGALDEPSAIHPEKIIFKDERQPWDTISVC